MAKNEYGVQCTLGIMEHVVRITKQTQYTIISNDKL